MNPGSFQLSIADDITEEAVEFAIETVAKTPGRANQLYMQIFNTSDPLAYKNRSWVYRMWANVTALAAGAHMRDEERLRPEDPSKMDPYDILDDFSQEEIQKYGLDKDDYSPSLFDSL
jgi:hypothetical protein